MLNEKLMNEISRIRPLDGTAMEESRLHWDGIAKPLGSLGKLEKAVTQIAGIQRNANICIEKKALIIMCADNGVVEEGISQSGPEVTAAVAENFYDEKSCVAIMCRKCGTDLFPIDIGMATDTPRTEKHKVAYGTRNFAKEPAMTREQAIMAIETGMEKIRELKQRGYQIIATGEMGIGNTTTSSAITAVFLGVPAETVTGRGAGLSTEGLSRKVEVIQKALKLHHPDPSDPIDVLAKVGGFDIAGLAGVFLGGAVYGVPVVIDGVISAAAALTALRIAPGCGAYMMASHVSGEPASSMLLDALGKSPFLTCDMRLGEGSGAVAFFPLLDFASEIYHKMASFPDAGFEQYEHLE